MSEHLFTLPSDSFAITTDDCYTPKWVFDAMGLTFDLDVAAPYGGPWHVPTKGYFTAEDDGLAQPWTGLVWCNPPYSAFEVWADKWISHPTGVLLGYQLPQVRWTRKVFAAADVVAMTGTEFVKPDGSTYRLRQPVFVAFRGVGTEPAERLAAADPYGAVLYGRKGGMTLSGWCAPGPPGSKPDQFHEGCRVADCECPGHRVSPVQQGISEPESPRSNRLMAMLSPTPGIGESP